MTDERPSEPLALAERDHAAYARAVSVSGAAQTRRRLNRHAARPGAPLVLTGHGTAGVLAAWSRHYRDKHPGTAVFEHWVGATAESRWTERLLERLLAWLRDQAGHPEPLPTDPEARRELLPNWLARAAARCTLVLVLDAPDRLVDGDPDQDLTWLPEHLPPGVRLIVGVAPDAPAATRLHQRGWQVEAMADDPVPAAEPPGLPPDDVLPDLWASRRGPTAAELAAAGFEVPATGAVVYTADERLQLAGPDVRDRVRRRLLPDGIDRQQAHQALAGRLARYASSARCVDELPWQLVGARDWHGLGATLADPDTLLPLLRQRDRLDLGHYWRAWGADAELVAWYAACLPAWQQALAAESRAELLARLVAAFREAIPEGDLGPFIVELGELAEVAAPLPRARCLAVRGSWLAEQGDPAAEPLLRQALDLRLAELGPDHPDTRASRHELAAWYETRGQLDDARELYRLALRAREARLGEQSAELIPYLNNIGSVLKAGDDPDGAESWFRRALTLAERHYGNQHPTTASCLDNLAGVVYARHDFEQAETLYQRALGITETLFGEQHGATAAAAHNLGAAMDAREQFRAAEMLFQRALDIREAVYGSEHVDTASSLHNLAGVKDAMGRYDEAEPLYRRALANWESLVGSDHPATATTVNNLADLLRETGQHGEAEQLYQRNLATWRQLVGEDHPHTLMTLGELAGLYADQKRFDDAEPLLRDVVERTARILGRSHLEHINAVTRLAGVLRDTGHRDEARTVLQQTITSAEATLGLMSPRLQKLRRHLEALDVDSDRLH